MTPADITELNRFTERLRTVSRTTTVNEQTVPTNLTTERERVVHSARNGEVIEPRFEFPPPDDAATQFATLASTLQPETSAWHALHHATAFNDAELADGVASHDAERITEVTGRIHGHPDPAVLERASEILRREPAEDRDTTAEAGDRMSAERSADLLRHALEHVGLDRWTVRVEPQMAARMSVRASQSLVRVRADATFSADDVRRLIVHELGTHVARAHNGARQALDLLGLGVSGYLATEEGLAVHNEVATLGPDPRGRRRYALRVIAVERALRGGFSDVMSELLDHLEPEDAFDLTLRVKRGIADVGSPGAYTKDHVYLSGNMAVETHLADRPGDAPLLIGGKFGLQHLPAVRELVDAGVWVSPEFTARSFPLDLRF